MEININGGNTQEAWAGKGKKTLKGLVSQNQFQQLPDNALEHVEDVGRF